MRSQVFFSFENFKRFLISELVLPQYEGTDFQTDESTNVMMKIINDKDYYYELRLIYFKNLTKKTKKNNKIFWRYNGPNKKNADNNQQSDIPLLSYDPEVQQRLKRKDRKIRDKMKERQSKILSFKEIKSRRELFVVSLNLLLLNHDITFMFQNILILDEFTFSLNKYSV